MLRCSRKCLSEKGKVSECGGSSQGRAGRSELGETMMRFRLHSMVAILITALLLSGRAVAQEPAAPEKTPPAGQEASDAAAAASEQDVPEGPVEPVMSGPFPVMSRAAEDRGRQIFEMFNHAQGSQIWALL